MPPAVVTRPRPTVGGGAAASREEAPSVQRALRGRLGFFGSSGGMPNSPGGSATSLIAKSGMNVGRTPVGTSWPMTRPSRKSV
jgi:hypothetical protein